MRREEADAHEAEVHRLASEAERAYDAAYYCLNHVIDVEGSRWVPCAYPPCRLHHELSP